MTKAEFVEYLRAVIKRQRDEFPNFEMVDDSDAGGLMVDAGGTRFKLDVRVTGPSVQGGVLKAEPDVDTDEERITRAINASIEETRINGTVSPDTVRQSLDELYARKRAERDARREAVDD